jgi:ribosomal protein S21
MNTKFQGKTRSGKPIKNYRKRVDFVLPGVPSGVKVPGPTSGDLEKALKVFKRQMKDNEKLDEYRARREYTKPAAKKRKKMDDAIRAEKRRVRLQKAWDKKKVCWTMIIDGKAK